LSKSIISDLFIQRKKFFIYLSEEKRLSYIAKIKNVIVETEDNSLLDLMIFSEVDSQDKILDFKKFIKRLISEHKLELIIFDNITTSSWYGTEYKQQAQAIKQIKEIVEETGICFLAFAHTNSKIKENHKELISQEDIEGARSAVKMADYIYIVQKIISGKTTTSFVRTAKSRHHDTAIGAYILDYNYDFGMYIGDKAIEFKKLIEAHKGRNKL
jgi:hypothetical protein